MANDTTAVLATTTQAKITTTTATPQPTPQSVSSSFNTHTETSGYTNMTPNVTNTTTSTTSGELEQMTIWISVGVAVAVVVTIVIVLICCYCFRCCCCVRDKKARAMRHRTWTSIRRANKKRWKRWTGRRSSSSASSVHSPDGSTSRLPDPRTIDGELSMERTRDEDPVNMTTKEIAVVVTKDVTEPWWKNSDKVESIVDKNIGESAAPSYINDKEPEEIYENGDCKRQDSVGSDDDYENPPHKRPAVAKAHADPASPGYVHAVPHNLMQKSQPKSRPHPAPRPHAGSLNNGVSSSTPNIAQAHMYVNAEPRPATHVYQNAGFHPGFHSERDLQPVGLLPQLDPEETYENHEFGPPSPHLKSRTAHHKSPTAHHKLPTPNCNSPATSGDRGRIPRVGCVVPPPEPHRADKAHDYVNTKSIH